MLLKAVLAAARAEDAGGFDPGCRRLEFHWANQDRRYDWYGAEAVGDMRRYGMPPRSFLRVSASDPVQAQITIIADTNSYEGGPPPRIRLVGGGAETERITRAFEAAKGTLEDEELIMNEYSYAVARAMDKPAPEIRVRRSTARRVLTVIEAHPTAVGLFGAILGATVALLAK